MDKNFNWSASKFFSELTTKNKLAKANAFTFCNVSGLDGFEEALSNMQNTQNFVCVSDVSEGYMQLNNTPHARRVKTVFLAMRHAIDDMAARQECYDIMQELFRQFSSVLILEKTKIEQHCIYIDPRISFNEIEQYFFSGCACAYFQVAFDIYTDLRFNEEEWESESEIDKG